VTDPVQTPDPALAAALRERDTLQASLTALQTDNAGLSKTATDNATALAAALRERDTFKQQATELEPRAKQADELKLQVEGYVNAGRETALVEALRAKLPGAEPLVIRGMLTTLHDAKRLNKFAEDPTAELAKALPIITAEAPSLTRPPTAGGGSAGVRTPAAAPAGNVSLFRPTPKP
jgi:hypothetical protein